ncbi:hypothetical protein D9619_008440 [Psilocybe cf. subviscida]|uniref:Uncharacterized protein n=1 Tax=Psilocybe cf. subviscida TaxID=2480587 RepID=A0A8H5B9S1_9AGAR|nr:hypothetical protein D9619_008440 [Psilocybe cf. subviscida]
MTAKGSPEHDSQFSPVLGLSTKELRARLLNYVAATNRLRAVFGNILVLDERAVDDEAAETESSDDDSDDEPEERQAP